MAVYNLSITADANDGQEANDVWNDKTDEGYYPGEVFNVAQDTEPTSVNRGALRFVSSGVPQGATITSAILTINIIGVTNIDAVNSVLTIVGDDVDNSAAFGSGHRPSSGWTDTSATANLSGLATGEHEINVTTIVQEIVNRAGFSGGSISFKLIPTGSDTYWSIRVADYDADTTATLATLDITTADGGSILRQMMMHH